MLWATSFVPIFDQSWATNGTGQCSWQRKCLTSYQIRQKQKPWFSFCMKAIHQIQWVNILNNSCPVRCSSGFHSRPIVVHPAYSGCFSYCWGAGFFIHGYADDLQLYDHCLALKQPSSPSVTLTASRSWANGCPATASSWMHRKRSSSGWARLADWLDAPSTQSSSVAFQFNHPPQSTVRDLGAYIDSGMSYTDHVTRLTRTCFFHIRQLRSIRRSLTVDFSHALVRALILADWTTAKCLLGPLSRVRRAAACLILQLPPTSSVENDIRTVLHWLNVPAMVTFKLCLLAHRCLHGSAPPYLIRYFIPVSSIVGRSHLRSNGTVFVPGSRTSTIGPRAFAIFSPSAWNSLPVDLRDPGLSLLTFRRRFKTYLFNPPGYFIFLAAHLTAFPALSYLFVNCQRLLWQFFLKPYLMIIMIMVIIIMNLAKIKWCDRGVSTIRCSEHLRFISSAGRSRKKRVPAGRIFYTWRCKLAFHIGDYSAPVLC